MAEQNERTCPECGEPWTGEWCEACGLYQPCSRCGTRTEVGGRCPSCGRSIFEDLEEEAEEEEEP